MKIVKLFVLLNMLLTVSVVAKTHIVLVSSNVFTPRDLLIEAGDTVRWINTGGSHNVYEATGRFRCALGCEANGGNGNPSPELWESEVTFHAIETVNYICQPHIGFGMQGSITVVDPLVNDVVLATLDNEFVPNELTIVEGQKVNFMNQIGNHNLHFSTDNTVCSLGCSNDGTNLSSSPTGFPWDIFIEFNQIGDFPYFCEAHSETGTPGIIRVIADIIYLNGFD